MKRDGERFAPDRPTQRPLQHGKSQSKKFRGPYKLPCTSPRRLAVVPTEFPPLVDQALDIKHLALLPTPRLDPRTSTDREYSTPVMPEVSAGHEGVLARRESVSHEEATGCAQGRSRRRGREGAHFNIAPVVMSAVGDAAVAVDPADVDDQVRRDQDACRGGFSTAIRERKESGGEIEPDQSPRSRREEQTLAGDR